jgi:hypothetical protein
MKGESFVTMDDPKSIVTSVSPLELIQLMADCDREITARKNIIDKALSERFAALDPGFLRVAVSKNRDSVPGGTRFSYFVKHPKEHLDAAKYYPMIVSSGRSPFDGKANIIWVSFGSTGNPTEAQMDILAKADAELRIVYEEFMQTRPVIASNSDAKTP